MKGDHVKHKKARGATTGGYTRPRVQIGFDPDTLREIERCALRNDRSFAAEVRALVDIALKQNKPWREHAAQATGG